MRSPLPVAAQSPGQGIQGGGSGVGTTSVENVKVQLRRLRGSGGWGGQCWPPCHVTPRGEARVRVPGCCFCSLEAGLFALPFPFLACVL